MNYNFDNENIRTDDSIDVDTVDASVRGDTSRNPANCRFYTRTEAGWGPCSLFHGKVVSKSAWCKGWVAKA